MNFKAILFFFISVNCFAQFHFTGEVTNEYAHAKVYLEEIKDLRKRNHIVPENIIQETKIIDNFYEISGSYLENDNTFYKIYIDNCKEGITNSKHLLNQCNGLVSFLFITKNTDSIFFPLNESNQMFCSFNYSKNENMFINQLDSLQEVALIDLPNCTNDRQRKIIYKSSFLRLKKFGKALQNPMAEIYAYYLYANPNSFSREFYLQDLNKSSYYSDLIHRVSQQHLESDVVANFVTSVNRDKITSSNLTDKKSLNYVYILLLFLVISLFLNYYFIKKHHFKKKIKSLKELLSNQEYKVAELLMRNKTNKEIAQILFISLSTVKTHVNSIFTKLNMKSRKEINKFKK